MSNVPSSYPSPTQAQMQGDSGPFYNTAHDGRNTPQEMAEDAELRANLSRSLAPMLALPQHDRDGSQVSPQHYDHHDHDAHAQLTHSVLGLHEHQPSPTEQDLDGRNKDKRQKVSRACDECRRKKAR